MATNTIDKPIEKVVEQPSVEPKSGVRAIIWNPAKDPTSYDLPRIATEMRQFIFAYLDEESIDITPLSPTGAVIPSFKTFVLQPGLNWVDESILSGALHAAAIVGAEVQRVTPGVVGALERLRMTIRQGSDPIAVQTKAGAINILEPLPKALMTGTLSDYGIAEIAEICAVVNSANDVESWLSSVVSNSVNPHPQKRQVEALLKKTLADINAGNR